MWECNEMWECIEMREWIESLDIAEIWFRLVGDKKIFVIEPSTKMGIILAECLSWPLDCGKDDLNS